MKLNQEKNRYILAILAMIVTLLISDFIYFAVGKYEMYFGMYFLLYIIGYFYIIMFSRIQIKFNVLLILFLFLRLYIFFIACFDDNYAIGAFELSSTGDPVRYHIDRAINRVSTFDNPISYLFSSSSDYSGRLTHFIIYMHTQILFFIGLDGYDLINIGKINYLFNTIINIITLIFVYKASYIYSSSKKFSRRSVFFLAFNPFFLVFTSGPKKETIIILALAIFVYFITNIVYKRKANYYYLYFTLFILFFERVYMVPLIIGIYLYINDKKIASIFILIGTLILIELFIGIEPAIGIYQSFRTNITSDMSNSYAGSNNIISDFLRTMFGPAFIRGFVKDYIDGSILSILQYFSYLILYYIAVKSLFYRKGLLSILFLTHLYIFLFWPFHSTLKITIVTVFTIIFLDKISFVKFKRTIDAKKGTFDDINNNNR